MSGAIQSWKIVAIIGPELINGAVPKFGESFTRISQMASNADAVRCTVCIAISQTPGRNLMRRIGMALAIVAMMSGSVATAQTAYAAQSTNDTTVYTPPSAPRGPGVHMLDCRGTTGNMGCGPGWIWRDGWRGWACYPC
jgi:hypothetical protein